MGNIVEATSREIARVARIRQMYEELEGQPRVNIRPVMGAIDHLLEQAHKAMGSGDVIEMIRAHAALKEIKE